MHFFVTFNQIYNCENLDSIHFSCSSIICIWKIMYRNIFSAVQFLLEYSSSLKVLDLQPNEDNKNPEGI